MLSELLVLFLLFLCLYPCCFSIKISFQYLMFVSVYIEALVDITWNHLSVNFSNLIFSCEFTVVIESNLH